MHKAIRLGHPVLFIFTVLAAAITGAITASLVAHYEDIGYPSESIRDRVRLLLSGSIFSFVAGIYLLVGVAAAPGRRMFSIFVHVILLTIAFLLTIIGTASLTGSLHNVNCSSRDTHISRCSVLRGSEIIGWITTVFIFIDLVIVFGLGVKARSHDGMRQTTLADF